MNSFRLFGRQARSFTVVAAMLVATLAPALVSAAQITERSIALSSSSASADGVTYQVSFKPVANAAAFVVDFCENTPLIGETCTSPVGFSAVNAASTTPGFTTVNDLDANTIVVTGTIDTGVTPTVTVDITGINNPDNAGPLYARIITYDTVENANLYQSTALGNGATDDGSVAISITPTIGVTGAVLESMTFCVADVLITQNCANAGDPGNEPAVPLGQMVGGVLALTETVSEGSIYAQLSTNAVNGAIVSLKSNATGCGGLLRAGAPSACDIVPAVGGISNSEAEFGVKVAPAADPVDAVNPNGTLQAAAGYDGTTFALDYVAGDATGVTSTYGDELFNSSDAPVNNRNMQLTFGAAISNDTPAGSYSADLSLIATGKF